MEEKWKPIKPEYLRKCSKTQDTSTIELKYKYEVSNLGRIKKVDRGDEDILCAEGKRCGHNSVHLSVFIDDKPCNIKRYYVHRLVAFAFVDNADPEKNKIVNHLDGNKENNRADNLEWTSVVGNNQHAIDNGLIKLTKRAVIQYDDEDNKIAEFESLDAASKETDINDALIVNCCKGKRIHAGGFKWKYRDVNPNENPDVDLDQMKQVKDFPNYYVDKSGKIYSKPYHKWLKQTKTGDGLLSVQLANKGKRKTFLVHRLVAEHYLDGFVDKCQIKHRDKDGTNNNVDNLKICK